MAELLLLIQRHTFFNMYASVCVYAYTYVRTYVLLLVHECRILKCIVSHKGFHYVFIAALTVRGHVLNPSPIKTLEGSMSHRMRKFVSQRGVKGHRVRKFVAQRGSVKAEA